MEWLKPLSGQVVGLDTAPLIYFIERHPLYHPLVEPFFTSVERGEIEVVTWTLTITEVLVHPYRVVMGRSHGNTPTFCYARGTSLCSPSHLKLQRKPHAYGPCTVSELPTRSNWRRRARATRAHF